MAYGDGDLLVDLERGAAAAVSFEEEGCAESTDLVSSSGVGRTTPSIGRSNAVVGERIELLIDKCEEVRDVVPPFEKRSPREQQKKQHLKKSSKPPRPPKGPLLNASDLKLVKELSEMAARKRARIERMKALRKMNDTKRSTLNGSLPALVITVVFLMVMIFQGVLSGSNTRKELVESPAPATTNEGFISIRVLNNGPTNNNEMNQPSSPSFNYMEQPSSISPWEAKGREAG